MRIGGRERGEPDQAEDWEWIHRDCGREWVSICGIRIESIVGIRN